MIKWYLALLCICLPILRANSQALAPIRPLVVTLDSGTVTRRPLIGLDTAYYRVQRLRLDRLALLEADRVLAGTTESQLRAELARCRTESAKGDASFDVLAHDTRALELVTPQPPLLLDGHFYKGVGIGAVLTVVLKVAFFR